MVVCGCRVWGPASRDTHRQGPTGGLGPRGPCLCPPCPPLSLLALAQSFCHDAISWPLLSSRTSSFRTQTTSLLRKPSRFSAAPAGISPLRVPVTCVTSAKPGSSRLQMVLVLQFISCVSTWFLQHVTRRVKVNYYILQTQGRMLTPPKWGDIFQRMACLSLVGNGSFCL